MKLSKAQKEVSERLEFGFELMWQLGYAPAFFDEQGQFIKNVSSRTVQVLIDKGIIYKSGTKGRCSVYRLSYKKIYDNKEDI